MTDPKDSTTDDDKPAWYKALYSAERTAAFEAGTISLRIYQGITIEEMVRYSEIGFRFYEQGKYNEARAIFSGLILLEPRAGYNYMALGVVYAAEENFEKARYYFDSAIAVNPRELAAYINRGELSLREGKLDDGEKDLKKALTLGAPPHDPFVLRAQALLSAIAQMKAPPPPKGVPPGKPNQAKGAPQKPAGKGKAPGPQKPKK